jgi:dolichol-phosphate mannosyltransferase
MIIIILPCYNEGEGLRSLLPRIDDEMRLLGERYRILVVDDGSIDESGSVAETFATRLPVTVLRHPVNRGLWETIRDGFEWAAESAAPEDILVRMDADDTHDPALIAAMTRVMRDDPQCGVVIASRFAPGGKMVGVSAYRRFVSASASWVLRLLFPIQGVRDYSCGYRAYRAGVIQDALRIYGNAFIDLRGVGFTCTVEKLLRIRSLGVRVREVPLVLRYDRKHGPSKMLSGITTLGYVVLILKNIYPWGEHGKAWQRAIDELRREQGRVEGDDH